MTAIFSKTTFKHKMFKRALFITTKTQACRRGNSSGRRGSSSGRSGNRSGRRGNSSSRRSNRSGRKGDRLGSAQIEGSTDQNKPSRSVQVEGVTAQGHIRTKWQPLRVTYVRRGNRLGSVQIKGSTAHGHLRSKGQPLRVTSGRRVSRSGSPQVEGSTAQGHLRSKGQPLRVTSGRRDKKTHRCIVYSSCRIVVCSFDKGLQLS